MTYQQLLFSFEGRITRQIFWAAWGVGVALSFLIVFVHPLFGILSLALIWPQIAIGCKRFHDFGKTYWLQLIGLIPIVGGLIVLVWAGITPSDPGDNAYGPPFAGLKSE
ncbi:MAG: DUF805 domain-containing protein [Dehalococcoidia bacterium]|jgi:uncharacterized membrane protein YhaH (DUF805 family)|nr:DUF805 domain-containing protein [Dehalococcoidia bacterium]